MSVDCQTGLIDLLRQWELLDAGQLAELRAASAAGEADPPGPGDLGEELIRRGWLTPFQLHKLQAGRGQELVLGNYVLLDELGAGGMGQVFKARHRRMGRVVAVKALVPGQLSDVDGLVRFQREIRAAAQLEHPNVVRAYDADQAGGVPFFAMEYVDGTDLGKLVEKQGPLPVGRACDYVRQAALGLQHAHEQGLVHRDIKPGNLLLSARDQVVKLLDLGIARASPASVGQAAPTPLTQAGVIVGTPDFLAPEQARNAHAADIRSDIYSLGCTLYYLLTGAAPFPVGTIIEKVFAHQFEKPKPLSGVRPEVPPALSAVVDRLLAKAPADRFQTPAEVADALAPFAEGGAPPSGGSRAVAVTPAPCPTVTTHPPEAPPAAPPEAPSEAPPPAPSAKAPESKPARSRVLVAACAALLLLVGASSLTWKLRARRPSARSEGPGGEAPAATESAERPRPAEGPLSEPAVAALKRLQAVVTVSANSEVPAVVAVDCTGTAVCDADLIALESLPSLEKLYLFGAPVGDAGLAHLRDLSRLEVLGLSRTHVRDPGLAHLRALSQLQELWLNQAEVTDEGLAHLERLGRLRRLHLAGTRISDAGLRHLGGLTKLLELELRNTKVGAGLSHLRGLPELRSLDLGNTPTGDADLVHLRGLANLRTLNLAGTAITDAGLKHLSQLRALQTLDLTATKVTDGAVQELQRALPGLKVAR